MVTIGWPRLEWWNLKKIDRGIIIFIFSVTILVFTVWQLIHTKQMASFISHEVTGELARRYGVKIKFDSIDISLIPLATNLNRVRIEYKQKVVFDLARLKIEFDFIDLLTNRFTIKRLLLSDGKISASGLNTSSTENHGEIRWRSFGETVRNYVTRYLPIKVERVALSNISLYLGDNHILLEQFKCGIYRNVVSVQGRVGAIHFNEKAFSHIPRDVDMVEFDGHITKKTIRVKRLKVRSKLEGVEFSGMLSELHKSPTVEGKGRLFGRVERFHQWAQTPIEYRTSGSAVAMFDITKSLFSKPELKIDMQLANFFSPTIGSWDRINASGKISKMKMSLSTAKGVLRHGGVELLKNVDIFDLKENRLLEMVSDNKIELSIRNIDTNNALYFLKEILTPLKGTINGNVSIGNSSGIVDIYISSRTRLDDFSLMLGGDVPVLVNPSISFNDSLISYDFNTGATRMQLDVGFGSSSIKADATLNSDSLNFHISPALIDLDEFGPIAGVPMSGICNCTIDITGPYENVVFDFDTDIKKFSILGLALGDIKSKQKLGLQNLQLDINSLVARYKTTKYTGSGYLNFSSPGEMKLDVNMSDSSLQDSLEIFSSLLPNPHHVPKGVDFRYKSNFNISGGFSLPKIKIDGSLKGDDILWAISDRQECLDQTTICPQITLNSVESDFHFKDKILRVNNILVRGRNAEVNGDFSFNTELNLFSYSAYLSDLSLREFATYNFINPGFDGTISGNFIGSNHGHNFVSDSVINILNAHVGGRNIDSSLVQISTNDGKLSIWGNFLGEMLIWEGLFDFSNETKKTSYVKGELNAEDIRIVAGLLSHHNIVSDDLDGNIDATFDLRFSMIDWTKMDLELGLNQFSFAVKDKEFRLLPRSGKMLVRDGNITQWDMELSGTAGVIKSHGEGSIDHELKILNEYNIDATILNLASPRFSVLAGRNKGKALLISKQGKFSMHLESVGSEMTLRIDKVKGVVDNLDYSLIMEDNLLLLKEANARYGNGSIGVNGSIALNFPFPTVDIGYTIESVQLPLPGKSSVVVSGKGGVNGDSFPYMIKGGHSIIHGEIKGSLSDFTQDGGVSLEGQRFIPVKGGIHTGLSLFSYDLGVNVTSHIMVKNKLAELYLNGQAHVLGTSNVPQVKGEITIKPKSSKLLFKGHEFILSEGKLTFEDNLLQEKPLVKIIGSADVGNYKVDLSVEGKSDNPQIKFISDPYLSHEDILSLLALGMTSETSQGLESQDRQSITSIGLGTFLVDQFQLGQELKSSLGLKLSVLPEWEKDETSLLKGRSSSSDSSSTKLKSTTKIKVQKKLGNKLGMAISSTVGGSMGQKHEMNLDYKLGRNLSLLGIYEIKDVEDSGAAESSSSAGIDLKFRMSFK
jgi:translocation and assembly module TamB